MLKYFSIQHARGQYGFAALYLSVIAMSVMLTLGVTITLITLGRIATSQEVRHASLSLYAAESGVEDALLRINKGKEWTSSYQMDVGASSVDVSVSSIVGGARTITGQGTSSERVRNTRVVHQLATTSAQLHYGAHIGPGGLHLSHNNAHIIGNVFSNGNVTGNGPATIENSVIVAGEGNSVNSITIGENVQAYSCLGASVGGDVEYHTSGTQTCSLGGTASQTEDIVEQEEFAITQEMRDGWKDDAEGGGIIDGGGDVHIGSNRVLGPGKITGDLTIANNTTLTIAGVLWVTGSFTPGNNAIVQLDQEYGDVSGQMIVEGAVQVDNNVILRGSGSPSSFLMIVGESASLDEGNPAIRVNNNADNAILFAPNGLIVIANNADVVEILAHRLQVDAATIEYDIGLADTKFSSGPAAGWTVARWREVE